MLRERLLRCCLMVGEMALFEMGKYEVPTWWCEGVSDTDQRAEFWLSLRCRVAEWCEGVGVVDKVGKLSSSPTSEGTDEFCLFDIVIHCEETEMAVPPT